MTDEEWLQTAEAKEIEFKRRVIQAATQQKASEKMIEINQKEWERLQDVVETLVRTVECERETRQRLSMRMRMIEQLHGGKLDKLIDEVAELKAKTRESLLAISQDIDSRNL